MIPQACRGCSAERVNQVDGRPPSFNQRPQPIVGASQVGLHHPSDVTVNVRKSETGPEGSNSRSEPAQTVPASRFTVQGQRGYGWRCGPGACGTSQSNHPFEITGEVGFFGELIKRVKIDIRR